MYNVQDEDVDSVVDQSQTQSSSLEMQLPVLELLKVCLYHCNWLIYSSTAVK